MDAVKGTVTHAGLSKAFARRILNGSQPPEKEAVSHWRCPGALTLGFSEMVRCHH